MQIAVCILLLSFCNSDDLVRILAGTAESLMVLLL